MSLSPINECDVYTAKGLTASPAAETYVNEFTKQTLPRRGRDLAYAASGQTTAAAHENVALDVRRLTPPFVVLGAHVPVDIHVTRSDGELQLRVAMVDTAAAAEILLAFVGHAVVCRTSCTVVSHRPLCTITVATAAGCVPAAIAPTRPTLARLAQTTAQTGGSTWAAGLTPSHVAILRYAKPQWECDTCDAKFNTHRQLAAHMNIPPTSSTMHVDTNGVCHSSTTPPVGWSPRPEPAHARPLSRTKLAHALHRAFRTPSVRHKFAAPKFQLNPVF